MKIELDYIEKLVKLVTDNELTEITVEEGEKAIIIKKENVAAPVIHSMPAIQQSAPMQANETVSSPVLPKTEAPKEVKKGLQVTSPMVGTFYRSATPGGVPFTEVGKSISVDQPVCIIEAMKLMNEITSEVSGKVIEILAVDGQPVEYGQVLMIVEP